jgi:hypothetical protein
MPKFSNQKALSSWLSARPTNWTTVLLSRLCLRALPNLTPLILESNHSPIQRNLALQIFRGTILLTAQGRTKEGVNRERFVEAADALSKAASEANRINKWQPEVLLEALKIVLQQRGSDETAALVFNAAEGSDDRSLRHFESDTTLLEETSKPTQLARSRLYGKIGFSRPVKPVSSYELLNAMRLDQWKWRSWENWYESKIIGAELFGLSKKNGIEVELAIANFPKRKWDAGVEAVEQAIQSLLSGVIDREEKNREQNKFTSQVVVRLLENLNMDATNEEIEQLLLRENLNIERGSLNWTLTRLVGEQRITRLRHGHYSSNQFARSLEAVDFSNQGRLAEPEPQRPIALQFQVDGDGRISVDVAAGQDLIRDDPDTRERHAETTKLGHSIVTSFDPSALGANTAAELIEDVSAYLEALGDSPPHIRPSILVMRGDGLRQYLQAQKSSTDLTDLAPLSDRYMLKLQRLVAAHNLLVSLDAQLSSRDEALLGPDEKPSLIAPKEGQKIIRDAVNLHIASADVEQALLEEGSIAPATPSTSSRISRRYSESIRNFARAIAASATRTARYLWQRKRPIVVTAATLPPTSIVIAKWVVANESWFLSTFSGNPHMLNVVHQLLAALRSLPIL